MKVLHLSTAALLGGAGIAAHRLHKGLRSLGVDSSMLVNKQPRCEDDVVGPVATLDKVMAKLAPRLERIPGRFSSLSMERVSPAWVPDRLPGRIGRLKPDILNLHWVNNGFMRIETLARFRQPVVWTLHDMWPFSGGEHYIGECVRYREGYSARNRPANETRLDVNRWIWSRKKQAWSDLKNFVVASPSKWLAECAGNSDLFHDYRVIVLPNGIDHERFHPVDHDRARAVLGLPQDKKLMLFGAGSATSDRRKGFHLLVEALEKMESEVNPADYELLVFGASSGDDSFSMKTHYLGNLQDEAGIAMVYAAADVFVAPSLEDNLPNTVLESLSCGTPVVAFDVGGMPDMVSHKNNGYLVPAVDTTELAKGLMWVMADEHRWQDLSAQARDTVVQSFTLQRSAGRYLDLYAEMLDQDRRGETQNGL